MLAAALLVLFGATAALADEKLSAFEAFVASGDYESANFYLANGFVAAADADSGQMFFSILVDRYGDDLTANMRRIDQLYNYLSGLGAIDLNRRFACGDGDVCLVANWLAHGARTADIAWFVERGLDLNKREPDLVPATLPMIVRLGSTYGMSDLNWFVNNGMVLGDETYTIEELLNYRDHAMDLYYEGLVVPDNFLNLGPQNFLDVLIMNLATRINGSDRAEAQRRDVMCSFITYAAAAYTPSFDYLRHVLQAVGEFRGVNIGTQVRGDGGVYAPFPTSCVLLVKAMAIAHAQLDQITDEFASQRDVTTAAWLLSIKQGK